MELTIVLEPQEEGGFTAYVPSLPGCISEGNTKEEAIKNIKEAIEVYVEDCVEDGEIILANESITLSLIDLPIKNA